MDDVLIIGHVINHWLSRRFLTVGFIWRGFWVGIGIILIELLIWDVFGCERGGDGVGEHLEMCSRSPAFPIRQLVPVGLGLAIGRISWRF